VWVPITQFPTAPASARRQVDGGTWCRRVNRATLDHLRAVYAADQEQLKTLLG
jgi:hypothetical protein